MASRAEVVDFLNLFKGCVMLEPLHVRDRDKNRQGLIDLGITPDERKEILLGLKPENYASGPTPDDTDDTKEVWIFGRQVLGKEVYIKLRVVEDPRKQGAHRATVWSFHPAEFTMKYPLRGGGS
ncbi:MAG: type II toxin-antitoxin system MqsR family toxin [Phycisphaerae bacterium]|nr:type II toxin-antitoxin system MqsR family toxin [Planctomycetota bacterium]MBL7221891.1 type II toxin-antitoxin system MqsR family toxin [Phycisphaerae bacterium]